MKKIIYLISIIGLFAFASCDDDQKYGEAESVTVTINASTEFSGVEASRAVLGNEVDITNYVFLLYDGFERNNSVLKDIRDIANLPAAYELTMEGSGPYFAVMIANTTTAVLADQGIYEGSKLEDLFSATFDINTTDNNPDDAKKFTWSGFLEVNPDTRYLDFTLNPNLAKISVNVENKANSDMPTDNIQVVNIQVRNVPNKARFAQNALSKAKLFTSSDNSAGVTDWIDYEIEVLELASGQSTKQPLQWYLPHNELEKASSSGSRAQRAPENATFIEVDGVRRIDFMDTAYKIYPTMDEDGVGISNYDNLQNYYVRADYQYNFDFSITNDGLKYSGNNNVSDKNENTQPQKVKYPEGHNCYMVHPGVSRTAEGTIFEVPISQINRFWGHKVWFNPDPSTGKPEANEIGENDTWTVCHIWQDVQNKQLIYFCDENGTDITKSRVHPNNSKLTEYYAAGKGNEPIRFKLKDNATYGNVVIGVRKDGIGAYIWSWHLWITDYNPDAAPAPSITVNYGSRSINGLYVENDNVLNSTFLIDGQGYYSYSGSSNGAAADEAGTPLYNNYVYYGNVQHYNHIYDKYWSSDMKSSTVWDGTGIYADKWIMDRNLGAFAPLNADIKNPIEAFGLYYQFGRKDPFPYQTVYDYRGENVVSWTTGSGGTISNGVRNPTVFYGALNAAWATDGATIAHRPWHSLDDVTYGKKTIFDPCPPGWCMPVVEAFWFATPTQPKDVYSGNSNYSALNASTAVYMDINASTGAQNDKMRHFATITILGYYGTTKKHVDATYPMQGYRKDDGSTWVGLNESARNSVRGCYWTAGISNSNNQYGVLLQFEPAYDECSGHDEFKSGSLEAVKYYRNNRWVHRLNNPMEVNEYVTSRGQPVRCIQEPD